jgi:hypothetical protein
MLLLRQFSHDLFAYNLHKLITKILFFLISKYMLLLKIKIASKSVMWLMFDFYCVFSFIRIYMFRTALIWPRVLLHAHVTLIDFNDNNMRSILYCFTLHVYYRYLHLHLFETTILRMTFTWNANFIYLFSLFSNRSLYNSTTAKNAFRLREFFLYLTSIELCRSWLFIAYLSLINSFILWACIRDSKAYMFFFLLSTHFFFLITFF